MSFKQWFTGDGFPFSQLFQGEPQSSPSREPRPVREKDPERKKKSIRAAIAIVVVALAVVLGSQSFYTINEQENAVVTTLGTPAAVDSPGLHFKIPFLQQVQKVDMTIKGFAIGYDLQSGESIPDESLMITSDYNFVNVDFFVEYQVTDPVKVLYASRQPEFILKTLAQSYIRDTIGLYPVDEVITTGKSQIQSEIKEKIMARMEKEDIGIQLVNLTIQDAEPPTEEVLAAFKEVETAKQNKETEVNTANKYRSEQLPLAEAEADRILQEAQGQKEARINEAQGQAARFLALYAEYAQNPLVTKQRMFYEAMEEILPGMKVVIQDDSGSTVNILPLDPLTE